MRLRGRALGEWSLIASLLMALAGFAAWNGWLWRSDQLLYDAALSLTPRAVPDDIVIIAIDEESLRRIGRWPWRRAIHATLVEKLTTAGAAAVGFDVILTEPDTSDPEGDRVLAEALARNGHVVLPVVPQMLAPGQIAAGLPIEPLRSAAASLGHIEIQLDADGIARGVYMWGGTADPLFPQFALAAVRVSRGCMIKSASAPPSSPPSKTAAYWRRDVWLHPLFAGPPGTYRTVSYVDVLTGKVDAAALRDKIVLVGATAAGLGDQYPTPMSALGRPMPGIEVHANIVDALRNELAVEWLSPGEQTEITVILIGTLMLGLLFAMPRTGLILSGVALASALAGSVLLLRWAHFWLPPSALILGILLAYPLWSWRRLEAAQRFMDVELRELHEDEPSVNLATATDSVDPLENRIAIIRTATQRQRAVHKIRDDTIRFVSHDIRAPLASIIALADRPSDDDAPDAPERLRRAAQYARHALNLADEFFQLAKAETLDVRRFEPLDLGSLLTEARDEMWPIAESRKTPLNLIDKIDNEAPVLGDRAQLGRALINLISNAIKFSPPGSPIDLTLYAEASQLIVEVTDRGKGIAAADLDMLFQRFSRVGKPDEPGIGLGLVIVKTIIERHGGDVSVISQPGIGSTFRVRLPMACGRPG